MTFHKVHGLANPADLVTKHPKQHMAKKRYDFLDVRIEGSRAETAPTLNAFSREQGECSLDVACFGSGGPVIV